MKETKAQIMAGVTGVEKARVIGPNTVEYRVMGKADRVIRLHRTDIVTFHENGDITLNSGGWKTPTTKARMNEYLPQRWGIVQENSIWYLQLGKNWRKNDSFPFADGITIHPNDTVTGAGPDPKVLLKLKKRIKVYVDGFMATLELRDIPQPGPGDCWGCLKVNDKGDTVMGDGHLLNHLDEKYYVPSLLMNAIKEIPISEVARGWVGYCLHYHEQEGKWGADIARTQVAKSLTRYLYRHLVLAA